MEAENYGVNNSNEKALTDCQPTSDNKLLKT